MSKRLNNIFEKSKKVVIGDKDKIAIMSDCHRGNGNNYDNFVNNKNIFEAALKHYYEQGFTYVELGDGDEMWEVKNYNDIVDEHLDTFKLLKKFNDTNSLIMIYGNHDKCKSKEEILKKYFYKYYDKITKQEEDLLNNLKVYESLILNYKGYDIFMIHGHQVDLLNNNLWLMARFLVRYVWRFFEHIGIKDPTSAAKNYRVSNKIEKKMKKWSIQNNKMLITGHTHRPIFPKVGQGLYFNDGSCIHPNGITCLEIEKGRITLVKWKYSVGENNTIYVGREIIEGSESIANFFNTNDSAS